MDKNRIYLIIILTLVWIILSEGYSIRILVMGILFSAGCVYYCYKFLPLNKITGVNVIRFIMYPFYLIGQIYLAGIQAIKLILTDPKVDIVEIKTKITNDFLRVILANSITLTPGTVSLELQDERITVLWLREKTSNGKDIDNAGELIKGKLEKKLLKAQK